MQILADIGAVAKDRAWLTSHKAMRGMPVFGRAALVKGIIRQELDWEAGRQFTT